MKTGCFMACRQHPKNEPDDGLAASPGFGWGKRPGVAKRAAYGPVVPHRCVLSAPCIPSLQAATTRPRLPVRSAD